MRDRIESSLELEYAARSNKSYKKMLNEMTEHIRGGYLKPGTRIQSEKKLCELYGVNVYTVRKVMTRLKEEGYLYSVPKSGIFVRAATPESEDIFTTAAFNYSLTEISFATLSCLPLQKNLWKEIAVDYSTFSPVSELKINYSTSNLQSESTDVSEYGSLYSEYYSKQKNFIDIKHFFHDIVTNLSLMYDEFGVPVYYATPVLLYNSELLEKLGFKAPDFHSFETQMTYLDAIIDVLKRREDLLVPGTAQMAALRLGHHLREIFRKLNNPDYGSADFSAEYKEIFQKATDFWRRYRISYPKRAMENYRNFLAGETPFFFGMTSDYIRLSGSDASFRYGAAVMYNVDDSYSRLGALFTLSSDTSHPAEGIRFIQYLQRDEIQQKFAKIGNIPLRKSHYKYLPKHLLLPKNMNDFVFDFFQTPEEHYVCVDIVNVELWNIILRSKDLEEVLKDCFKFSRAYLNIAKTRMPAGQRDKWEKIYCNKGVESCL